MPGVSEIGQGLWSPTYSPHQGEFHITRPVLLQRSSSRVGESRNIHNPAPPNSAAVQSNIFMRNVATQGTEASISVPTRRKYGGGGKRGDRCISSEDSFAAEVAMGGCQVRSEATWSGAFRRDILNPRGFSNVKPPAVKIVRSPRKVERMPEPEPVWEPEPEPEPEPAPRYVYVPPPPPQPVQEPPREFVMPANPYDGLGWKGASAGWDSPDVVAAMEAAPAEEPAGFKPELYGAYGGVYNNPYFGMSHGAYNPYLMHTKAPEAAKLDATQYMYSPYARSVYYSQSPMASPYLKTYSQIR